MLRRQTISHDDWARQEYGTLAMQSRTPRKWTTYQAATEYEPDRLYANQAYRPDPDDPSAAWVGKIMIPWVDGDSLWDYAHQLRSLRESKMRNPVRSEYIHEYDIAKQLRGHIYRIVFARPVQVRDAQGRVGVRYEIVSKLGVERRPAQCNLVVDAVSMRILRVDYI